MVVFYYTEWWYTWVCRLKAEIANRDAEIRHLNDQLAESDSIRQQQIELHEYELGKQLEELNREMADISECSESTRQKLECEKNSLEAELTKALQDLVVVKMVTVHI